MNIISDMILYFKNHTTAEQVNIHDFRAGINAVYV